MPITTIETATKIDQLIAERYGKLPAAQRKQVHAAILAANPHLDEAATIKPGALLILPAQAQGAAARSDIGASPEMVAGIVAALSGYRDELVKSTETRAGELDLSLKTLDSPEFRRIADRVPGSADFLESIKQGSSAERDELQQVFDFTINDIPKLIEELKGL